MNYALTTTWVRIDYVPAAPEKAIPICLVSSCMPEAESLSWANLIFPAQK
jgi:hypothetical protein